MNIINGNKIVANFTREINSKGGVILNSTSISRNIFELSGSINCLLYIKAIAKPPNKWGVTENVVNRLKSQKLPWVVVLLFQGRANLYNKTSLNL